MGRIVVKTMEEAIADAQIHRARVAATTEEDIRRQMMLTVLQKEPEAVMRAMRR